MTYNYLFVNEILKGLTYCDKNKFCNETFVSTEKLKSALENEISKEIFLKNGLKNLKLPVKSVQHAIPTNPDYVMAIITFEDKFVNRQLDSLMMAICIDKQQNFRVFALKQIFQEEDKSDIKYFVIEQKLYQKSVTLYKLDVVCPESFAVAVDMALKPSYDDFDI